MTVNKKREKSLFFVLGAPDPEMERIESILTHLSKPYAYALKDGQRISPKDAYGATGTSKPVPRHSIVVLVECGFDLAHVPLWVGQFIRVDHHRPGDPGYSKPPEKFWEGSSIGQVYRLLDVHPSKEDKMIAAADHCLAAAYRGQCKGIDGDELMKFRISSKAKHNKLEELVIKTRLEKAKKALLSAQEVEDLPGVLNMSKGHTAELPEAAARCGSAYLAIVKDRGKGRKLVIGGDASKETVTRFMTWFGPKLGLTNIYGAPGRGFAGGTCPRGFSINKLKTKEIVHEESNKN